MLWLYLLFFVVLFTLLSFIGLRTKKLENYTTWSTDLLLDNNFDPPEIHVMKADRRSSVKTKNGVSYVYLLDQGEDKANKKLLVQLLAFLTSDHHKNDAQYYTNLDVLMNAAENKEGFKRIDITTY